MSQLAKSVIHNQVLRLAERRFGAATLPENERHRALSKAFAMLATMQLLADVVAARMNRAGPRTDAVALTQLFRSEVFARDAIAAFERGAPKAGGAA